MSGTNLLNVLEILSRRFSLTLSLFSSTCSCSLKIPIKIQLSIGSAMDLLAYSLHGRDSSFRLRNTTRKRSKQVFCLLLIRLLIFRLRYLLDWKLD